MVSLHARLCAVPYSSGANGIQCIPKISTNLSALLKPFGLAVTLDKGAPLDLDGNGRFRPWTTRASLNLSDEQKALCAALRAARYDPSTFYLCAARAGRPVGRHAPRQWRTPSCTACLAPRAHLQQHLRRGAGQHLQPYGLCSRRHPLVKHHGTAYTPGVVIGMFEKEEDGMMLGNALFSDGEYSD